ncbi:hypothetical protein CHELA40_14884 [Chelatococcus asaccharovorans]|nr:hypothetical protein CHELA40_14884 [Chelatococcus asaccharovorans]
MIVQRGNVMISTFPSAASHDLVYDS